MSWDTESLGLASQAGRDKRPSTMRSPPSGGRGPRLPGPQGVRTVLFDRPPSSSYVIFLSDGQMTRGLLGAPAPDGQDKITVSTVAIEGRDVP